MKSDPGLEDMCHMRRGFMGVARGAAEPTHW